MNVRHLTILEQKKRAARLGLRSLKGIKAKVYPKGWRTRAERKQGPREG